MKILYYDKKDDSYCVMEVVFVGYSANLYDEDESAENYSPIEGLYAVDTFEDEICFPMSKFDCNNMINDMYLKDMIRLTDYDYSWNIKDGS